MKRKTISLILLIVVTAVLFGCARQSDVPTGESAVSGEISDETTAEMRDIPYESYTPEILLAQLRMFSIPLPISAEFLAWCDELVGGEVFYPTMVSQLIENGYSDDLWFTVTGRTWRVLLDLYRLSRNEEPETPVTVMSQTGGGQVNLAFVGDINLADDGTCMTYASGVEGGALACIDESIISLLQSADIACADNECCFSIRGYPIVTKKIHYRSHPDNVSVLQGLGLDVVSLANNHIYDYSSNAVYDTLATLDKAGIRYVGAGMNDEQAQEIRYFISNGVKLAYVAATGAEVYRRTPEADEGQPGVFACYDSDTLCRKIAEARKKADYVVVFLHDGPENSVETDEDQTSLLRACVDSGADLVVGSHPQNIQSIEYYHGVPIVYSLGNFFFSTSSAECMVLTATFDARGTTLRVYPCRQSGGKTVNLSDTIDGYSILKNLSARSAGVSINTKGAVMPQE